MKLGYYFFGIVLVFDVGKAQIFDAAALQLLEYKNATKKPIGLLRSSTGKPIDIRETKTLNTELLTNQYFMEELHHSIHERIPERVVHAKGTGAFGYLEVTNDITKYCKAKLFEKVGKITQLAARFSVALENKGGNDLARDIRGFAMKFYTEEGNFDLLSTQAPVYAYRDPILFGPVLRSFKRNPKTNLRDFTASLNFVSLNPESLHNILWLGSDYGIPRGFRKMNVFPIHAFEINNKKGESFFVRFKFLSEQGLEFFSQEEAAILGGIDPDYFTRDLYDAIEKKTYPSWRMEMDVLTEEDLKKVDYDPFDVTSLWRNGTYKTVPIGRVVINRNVDNQFAEAESAAYNPANLVPGIPGPPDQLFKGRIMAYTHTQIYRLGVNRNNIKVNCPMYSRTYNRDGLPPVLDNMKDAPNYFPNSFNGPVPYVDISRPKRLVLELEKGSVDLQQSAEFYNRILTSKQRLSLVKNIILILIRVTPPSRQDFIKLLTQVNQQFGKRVEAGLAVVTYALNCINTILRFLTGKELNL